MKARNIGGSVVLSLMLGLTLGACGGGTSAPQADSKTVQTPSNQAAYPVKQIEYVVPYSAGGGVDLVARATADYLSKEWGQPIVVVNKPGGGGMIGAEYALKQSQNDAIRCLPSMCPTPRCSPAE